MVSIIIPTYNGEKYLPKLLEALKSQTIKDFELIIIDSSSKDSSVEIAKKYTDNIIVIPQNEFDHGGTRAKAAKVAKGEILIFLTQDALPYNEHTIENMLKAFEEREVEVAYGRQISYPETNIFGKHLREFNYPITSHTREFIDRDKYGFKTAFASNSFSAFRKEALGKIGYFEENNIFGEDAIAVAKILIDGGKVSYVGDAQVYHSHSYSIIEDFKRYFDVGVFHTNQNWLLDTFGKPEGEGMRYIKSEFKYLIEKGAWYLILEFIIRNGFKFLGYKIGKQYKRLPYSLVLRLSMGSYWFKKNRIEIYGK